MDDIVTVKPVDTEAELQRLASVYANAGGVGVQLLNMLGGKVEGLLERLPDGVRGNLDAATRAALRVAMDAANSSRSQVPDQSPWVNTALSTAMGVAGGMGGLPSALVELPVTTAVLLRSIQGVAATHGFDPASESVRFDCIRVFSAAGPLAQDDGADLGFLSVRLTLTGGTVNSLIAKVAPRLATVLGQKLAAQTIPVLGAVAGATANYVYSSYYQQIAEVHFGLRRLAIDAELPEAELVARLRQMMPGQLR
jgi:hypothetical protein